MFGLELTAFASPTPTTQGELLGKEGSVDFARGMTNWAPAAVGQLLIVADRLRTLAASRAMLQLAELGRLRVNELTTLEILPLRTNTSKATLDLKAGAMYFFSREKPREFLIQTPHAVAASRGTEFLVTLEPTGRNVFTVFDGEVELANPFGSLVLTNGEQGAAVAGLAPFKTAVIQATNIIQWWLYYPAVLDPGELPFTTAEQAVLAPSLENYLRGDLLAALNAFPSGRSPQSEAEQIYYAALLLSAGQVDEADAQLSLVRTLTNPADALRELISAVALQPATEHRAPETATEWLARSYLQQARFDLRGALDSARAAAKHSPNFGFAWARVAELEFSFGRTAAALTALEKSLQLSPRNAQAWALKGFLAAANNHPDQAASAFQKAIELDSALGNGWLGRGLMRLRAGERATGRADLQTAAAMEPNRSSLRSYLGKAFDNLNETANARKELRLARELDAADPTPWLYSALLLRQELRFNEAVADLEKSSALNDNRRVYRSRLLLDEDRAVRSSSLATIYQNAGMNDVSTREAVRAVAADYANPSAHLFLAESFNALRDPTRFNLRIETAWFNELLLANLLSPVGGGNLSQNISQQEYSRLFEGNHIGFSSFTEARSDKQTRELASQFGVIGNTGWALDFDSQFNDGVRPNNELSRIEWYTTVKHQFTPQDSILILTKYQDYHSGDNFQYYNPDAPGVVRTNFSFDEYQRPLAVAGYHHEWSPGVHTLLLGGRIENEQHFSDTYDSHLVLTKSSPNTVVVANKVPMDVTYHGEFEIYTAEWSQIFQNELQTLVVGSRYQNGTFDTRNQLTLPSDFAYLTPDFLIPPAADHISDPFERITGYGYYTLKLFNKLVLTGGVAYDRLTFPEDFRQTPISPGTVTRDQISPKAALVWSPLPAVTVRGVFSRALGGVSFDESFRLEPTQLAGFNQSFRTIISESIVGSVSAPKYEIAGGALDLKLTSRTYLGLAGEVLSSDVNRQIGVFDINAGSPPTLPLPPAVPSTTTEKFDYEESSIAVSINQLAADAWSFGAQYRFTQSELNTVYPAIPTSFPVADQTQRAELHVATLFALFNHPSGFFARAESQWYQQDNYGYTPALASEDFWQHNVLIGWRLKRQRGELSLGVLNLADSDYRLNPLNLYAELPRERVFVVRLKINL